MEICCEENLIIILRYKGVRANTLSGIAGEGGGESDLLQKIYINETKKDVKKTLK